MRSIESLLPVPTFEYPFCQFDFLTNRFIDTHNSESLKKKSRTTFKLFKDFLFSTNNIHIHYEVGTPFYFKNHIHDYTVVNFSKYLLENFSHRNEKTVYEYVMRLQIFFQYALDHSILTKLPYFVKTFVEQRSSDAYGPYSRKELDSITDLIILEERFYASQYICGQNYINTGQGKDPRDNLNNRADKINGWNPQNTVWYFENVMLGQILPETKENLSGVHKDFFTKGIARYPDRLRGFYKDLKIVRTIDANLVGLYALKLAVETGLNPESVFGLKVDCFKKSHPLTNKPFISYTKLRSSGDKELVFFDDEANEISYLKGSQAVVVERTISKIIELTALVRPLAGEDCRDYLLIYQSYSKNRFGKVVRFENKASYHYCHYLTKKFLLVDDNGKPLRLWFVRFRSTLITEMARVGKNIFEILAQAGHKKLSTTMGYIYRNNLEVDYQSDIKIALDTIHSNHTKSTDSPNQSVEAVISNCLDVFNPPFISSTSPSEVKVPCHRVHQCLSCSNVVISKKHLPILYKYYTDIISSVAFQEQELVFQKSYERTVAIIEHIFNKKSFFNESELAEAKRKALELPELFIDPQVSSGYVTEVKS